MIVAIGDMGILALMLQNYTHAQQPHCQNRHLPISTCNWRFSQCDGTF